jgi:hypothetical protein
VYENGRKVADLGHLKSHWLSEATSFKANYVPKGSSLFTLPWIHCYTKTVCGVVIDFNSNHNAFPSHYVARRLKSQALLSDGAIYFIAQMKVLADHFFGRHGKCGPWCHYGKFKPLNNPPAIPTSLPGKDWLSQFNEKRLKLPVREARALLKDFFCSLLTDERAEKLVTFTSSYNESYNSVKKSTIPKGKGHSRTAFIRHDVLFSFLCFFNPF